MKKYIIAIVFFLTGMKYGMILLHLNLFDLFAVFFVLYCN